MKKITSLLLLTATLLMLSSCLCYEPHRHHSNTLYVINESRYAVKDWTVEAEDGWKDYPEQKTIARGDYAKIKNLPDDYYRVNILLGEFEWYSSGYTDIYRDTNYYIKSRAKDDYFSDRSIVTSESNEEVLILFDDFGNEIELIKQ